MGWRGCVLYCTVLTSFVHLPWFGIGRDGDWTDVGNCVHQRSVVVDWQRDVRRDGAWLHFWGEGLALAVLCGVWVAWTPRP